MIDEFRQSLEAEAMVRLRQALRDKDAELGQLLEEAQQRVAAETTEKVTRAVTLELEERFRETLRHETDEVARRLSNEADDAGAKWSQERSQLAGDAKRWRMLSEYQRKVGEASSQLEILRRFLRTAVTFAASAAVYLNKDDGLALWNAEGEAEVFPGAVSEDTIDPDWFFSKVVVRGKMVAAVGAAGVTDSDALHIMTDSLKRSIENFGLRLRFLAKADADAPVLEPALKSSAALPRPASASPVSASPVPASPVSASNDPRQVARTVVAMIKTSHERQVLEGRVNSDLYARLRAEIEDARTEYRQQLSSPPRLDYFHEEVVKILADNVASRLGKEYPGPS
jgi:hypothetical protein